MDRLLQGRRKAVVFCLAAFSVITVGCNTPAAVSAFCASAVTALTAAQPVFADLKQSCLREVASRMEFGTFAPPPQNDPACAEIGKKTEGATAAVQVLADYFAAINSLASFGTAKLGSDASSLAAKTSAAAGAGTPIQKALGSITQFIVSAATSGYQQRQLEKELTESGKNISVVTQALISIVQEDYLDQLLMSEERKLTIRYKGFAKDRSPEVVLILDARWQADEQALVARRASGRSLVTALEALSKGSAELAAKAHRLKGAEVPGLLAPYASQLQAMIPAIQKAF